MNNANVAYLLISAPVANIYMGGAIVTDHKGLPLEFRYTDPVQPNRLQQILYGQVLGQYIKQEVILNSLIESLKTPFEILLVNDDGLLNAPQKAALSNRTMLRISETKLTPLTKGPIEPVSPLECLIQPTAESNPLRVQRGFSGETPPPAPILNEEDTEATSPSPPPSDRFQEACQFLLETGKTMDLYEPINRIKRALDALYQDIQAKNPNNTTLTQAATPVINGTVVTPGANA